MFATPEYVFKDGTLVARGRLEAVPTGGTHFVEPDYDPAIEKTLEPPLPRAHEHRLASRPNQQGRTVLLRSNHGSLLPCKLHGGGRT
ncbi:hypothetical protein [Thauera humireducens]|uniref:hypothetical protein n=1 Tax=Thauera humireducens TaxID=1134435 RepID=UPI00311E92FB